MGASLGDTSADGGQVVTVHPLGVLARGAEPRGYRPTLREDRFVGRHYIRFSQPTLKQTHHDFANRLPLAGALRLDAPIQVIGNLNGHFHVAAIVIMAVGPPRPCVAGEQIGVKSSLFTPIVRLCRARRQEANVIIRIAVHVAKLLYSCQPISSLASTAGQAGEGNRR